MKNENNALLFGRYIKRDMDVKFNRKRIVVKTLILTTKIEIVDGAFLMKFIESQFKTRML